MRTIVVFSLLVVAVPAALAGEAAWRAEAKAAGLSDAEIARLGGTGVLIGRESWRQVFTPYVEEGPTPFVTADSLLAGFHRLLMESVKEAEFASVARLPGFLGKLLTGLDAASPRVEADAAVVGAARDRARILVATALTLAGQEARGLPDPLAGIVREEVARVRAAAGQVKPAWLGRPDEGFTAIDYTRFTPRGFYDRTPMLADHFRAVSFLASIPFRLDRDEELLAVLLMAGAADPSSDTLFDWPREFLGGGDEGGLADARRHIAGIPRDPPPTLDAVREVLLARLWAEDLLPRVGDQVAFGRTGPCYRVFSPARLPCAEIFEATTRGDRQPRGLEFAAALGSSWAAGQLPAEDRAAIRGARSALDGGSLCHDYFRCLAALLDPPEKAPALFRGEAWQVKSVLTVLAGWSQFRHTFALHAKQNVSSLGSRRGRPLYVEPNPIFFRRLAGLAAKAKPLVAAAMGTEAERLVAGIRDGVADYRRFRSAGGRIGFEAGQEGIDALGRFGDLLRIAGRLRLLARSDDPENLGDRLDAALPALLEAAEKIEAGDAGTLTLVENRSKVHLLDPDGTYEVAEAWDQLLITAETLANCAERQIDGGPADSGDLAFFKGYGPALARIMLYGSDGYLEPADDAPLVIDVHADPVTGSFLEVGVSRPRSLYILYPAPDGPVFCRGVVLPYHEFSSAERLTDPEWQAMIDRGKSPPPAAWLGPILADGPARPPAGWR